MNIIPKLKNYLTRLLLPESGRSEAFEKGEEMVEEEDKYKGRRVQAITTSILGVDNFFTVTQQLIHERSLNGTDDWEKREVSIKSIGQDINRAYATCMVSLTAYLEDVGNDLFNEPGYNTPQKAIDSDKALSS
jgi:hypothetical protein